MIAFLSSLLFVWQICLSRKSLLCIAREICCKPATTTHSPSGSANLKVRMLEMYFRQCFERGAVLDLYGIRVVSSQPNHAWFLCRKWSTSVPKFSYWINGEPQDRRKRTDIVSFKKWVDHWWINTSPLRSFMWDGKELFWVSENVDLNIANLEVQYRSVTTAARILFRNVVTVCLPVAGTQSPRLVLSFYH